MTKRTKLGQLLFDKYPQVIGEYDGFECGPGWEGLIEDLFYEFAKLELPKYPPIGQIKEKFGGLRVYLDDYNEEMEKLIEQYEDLSEEVCISCGEIENVQMVGGWAQPLCGGCRGVS